jgi:threonine dehydrogenase-like Zn-dependent dehydrogenase
MRSAIFIEPGRLEIAEIRIPEPGPEEVLVRIEGCGVCASNLPVWEGRPWFQYPLEPGAPGHEAWGVVAQVGEKVKHVHEGDRVALLSNRGYAEYDLAPADSVLSLLPALAGKPFPGEPLGCAANIHRRSGIASGQTVAVIGVGFLGALLTQMAVRQGARVIALSRRPFALETARLCGAAEVLPLEDQAGVIQEVFGKTGGKGCDVVIECAGKQETLDLAGELTRIRGRLVIAGYHQDGVRRVNMQLWNWRGLDVINAHERETAVYLEGIRSAMVSQCSGQLKPLPLYTHTFGLARLAEALDLLRERPVGFLKGLVVNGG